MERSEKRVLGNSISGFLLLAIEMRRREESKGMCARLQDTLTHTTETNHTLHNVKVLWSLWWRSSRNKSCSSERHSESEMVIYLTLLTAHKLHQFAGSCINCQSIDHISAHTCTVISRTSRSSYCVWDKEHPPPSQQTALSPLSVSSLSTGALFFVMSVVPIVALHLSRPAQRNSWVTDHS